MIAVIITLAYLCIGAFLAGWASRQSGIIDIKGMVSIVMLWPAFILLGVLEVWNETIK